MASAGVGLLYRQALLEAFPGVEEGVRSIGDRLRGRQRSSLYQVSFIRFLCYPFTLYTSLCACEAGCLLTRQAAACPGSVSL